MMDPKTPLQHPLKAALCRFDHQMTLALTVFKSLSNESFSD